jgi:hypothetical protein
MFPGLLTAGLFLLCETKQCSERKRFASAEDSAKETMELTEVKKNGFQECFQRLYERWQKCVSLSK